MVRGYTTLQQLSGSESDKNMIEKDIKEVKKIHKKIEKNINAIFDWQKKHQISDDETGREVTEIKEAIQNLPTEQGIKETIKITVNGKIDKVQAQNEEVKAQNENLKSHLEEQDKVQVQMQASIKALSDKIQPLDGLRSWLTVFIKGLLWTCGVITAVGGAYLILIKVIT